MDQNAFCSESFTTKALYLKRQSWNYNKLFGTTDHKIWKICLAHQTAPFLSFKPGVKTGNSITNSESTKIKETDKTCIPWMLQYAI